MLNNIPAIAKQQAERTLFRVFRNPGELKRLAENSHPAAVVIYRAITATMQQQLTAHEQQWVDKIEALRQIIDASTDVLENASGQSSAQLTVGYISRRASQRKHWAMLLFNLVRGLQPETCLELGTSLGISGAYQAAALIINGHGKLITLEGSTARAELAGHHFRQLALPNVEVVVGWFDDTLQSVLEKAAKIDFAYIDGNHQAEPTIHYFRQIIPYSAYPYTILVFDDIRWSDGMIRAWNIITNDPASRLIVDLFKVGICVVGDDKIPKQHYKIAMD